MRPKGFVNPYSPTSHFICLESGGEWEKPLPSHAIFEAGADAYEEALKKGSVIPDSLNHHLKEVLEANNAKKGHLVFIEEA